MSENILYVIALENNKYFLHLSPPIYEDYLLKECIIMYDFVKNNRPCYIESKIDLDNTSDEINDIVLKINYYVKYYMKKYGVNNVRGGIYTDETLPDYLLQSLYTELNITIEDYEKNIEIIENVLQTYQNKQFDLNEKRDLENQLSKYNSIKDILRSTTNSTGGTVPLCS